MPKPQDDRQRRAARRRAGLMSPQRPADGQAGWSDGIRALYDGVAQEPLPAEFVDLLAELAKKSGK